MGVTDYKTAFCGFLCYVEVPLHRPKTQKKIITWQFMISFEMIWKPHAEINVRNKYTLNNSWEREILHKKEFQLIIYF